MAVNIGVVIVTVLVCRVARDIYKYVKGGRNHG